MNELHIFAFVLISAVIASSPALHCFSPESTSFKFSLLSSRNKTGHWTAQVQLGHGADSKVDGLWEVDIDHTAAKCDKRESIHITATIKGPLIFEKYKKDDYVLVPGIGYYKFHTLAKPWNEARRICLNEDAHLVIINSAQEMAAVKSLWEKITTFTDTEYKNYIHVGLIKNASGEFITIIDGEPLSNTGYTTWDTNEPNNQGGNENCLSVKNTAGFNDIKCELKLTFICEKEL